MTSALGITPMAPTLQKNLYVGANTKYASRLVPAADGKINGVNIGALNARTRTSRASAVAAVSTWTARTSAADSGWHFVIWAPELSIFVAVAYTGTSRVMTSPDGINWTARTAAADNGWYTVTWAPELSLFVAVAGSGTGNRVMTSPNGNTWTARTSASDNDWRSVTWSPELSIFVAVASSGTGNRVMTSPDGITWTSRTSAADIIWRSVIWAPELSIFVAVASSGTGNRVMTSPDGITWTSRTSAADNDWHSVIWAPELSIFVAVAYSGTGNRVMTSPDGNTWTLRTSAADNDWHSVTWAPELSIFVAVAYNGVGNRIMTSPDGITWTTRTSVDNQWLCLTWAPELSIFVAVAHTGTGNRVMTSAIGMPNSMSVVKALPSQMTVLPNGNVGIGTTMPKSIVHVQSPYPFSAIVNGTNYGGIVTSSAASSGDTNTFGGQIVFQQKWFTDYNDIVSMGCIAGVKTLSNGNFGGGLAFFTAPAAVNSMEERMRIIHNGNVGIGNTNPTYKLQVEGNAYVTGSSTDLFTIRKNGAGGAALWIIVNSGVTTQSAFLLYFTSASTSVGTISTNGTTTAYNTTSDYRLKNNVRPLTNAMSTVSQLKPCTWTWKSNGTSGQGFIAHELQEVAPECVTGTKDEVKEDGTPAYQGVDNSFLIAILTSAIQELKNELDTLKVRVNELEGGGSAI